MPECDTKGLREIQEKDFELGQWYTSFRDENYCEGQLSDIFAIATNKLVKDVSEKCGCFE
ncbi:hypothetical protein KM1_248710 [Entamoeba histolytica HM-3:IMSS]|uniref:Uncharacterized protein n=2 Tax=Entamoeba histolytica TaxID=5759 RepID=M7WXY9_ENTHI|nr:hypothetical protein KM1_248710 [Entamoeba histolytica HM-3:IMSS]